jgi:hypothetical protein
MTLQERFNTFENEARGRLRRVLATGNEKLLEIDGRLAKIASDDWSVPGMRRHLDDLRARAETLRATALKRAGELPGTAVSRVATGSRAPIQNLAKGLADLAKRIETPKPKAVEAQPEPKAAEPKIAKVS